MTERHAPIRDGNFLPFKELWVGDFDIDKFAKLLRLKHLQKELLRELLAKLEFKIWFWDKLDDAEDAKKDHRHGAPGLEANVFWLDYHVSAVDLFKMLEEPFENVICEIGYEEEIVVLNKLKAKVEHAIELRQQAINEREREKTNDAHSSSAT